VGAIAHLLEGVLEAFDQAVRSPEDYQGFVEFEDFGFAGVAAQHADDEH
jgi:hypothetical protein